jgi:molybdopterin-containing oxidoreductase family membrane subunit
MKENDMELSKAFEQDERVLLKPIKETNRNFYITVIVLSLIVAWAFFAYFHQFRLGLGVTGLNRPVYWGFYITNFVFFIGISHAGTLISAILRIAQAEWRRAITRSAEVITVMVIFFGVASILMDLGRPDRIFNIIKNGRFQSPLLWDVTSITAYLTASTIYLYLPLIPDVALMRDKVKKRKWLYSLLALGWEGTPRQWKRLELVISVMAILVIPVAVSVHTVVSFVFAMTVQPMWHSAIFGPYFVVGAIYSGIAALIIAMALIRWVYGLQGYLKDVHFQNLGILLFVMTLLWSYFTFSEYLTTFYGAEPTHMQVFWSKFSGEYMFEFWGMILCCMVIPAIFLSNRKMRTMSGMVLSSATITIGMWLERYIIVVPTLANPRLPYERGAYHPSWVELSLLAGCFAFFILLYVLFTKFFPIVSIWEIKEGRQHAVAEVSERIKTYLPDSPPAPEEVAASTAAPYAGTKPLVDNQ